jgi:hypothetical protein
MASVMRPSPSLQQISAMLHCHFALLALSNSDHPLFYPLQSALSPPSSFGVHYLSAEVTVKLTAQLLPLNAQYPFGAPPDLHI